MRRGCSANPHRPAWILNKLMMHSMIWTVSRRLRRTMVSPSCRQLGRRSKTQRGAEHATLARVRRRRRGHSQHRRTMVLQGSRVWARRACLWMVRMHFILLFLAELHIDIAHDVCCISLGAYTTYMNVDVQ